ncbi:MAG: hypothetical protein VW124_12260 [Paracoccaceae bacterium]
MSKILITGVDVAGHYSGLWDAFAKMSFNSDFLLIPNKFSYARPPPPKSFMGQIYNFISGKVTFHRTGSKLKFLLFYLCFRLVALIMPFWAASKYEKIYFIGGDCFSRTKLEYFLYKKLGIKIYISFHGSDLRPLYLNGMEMNSTSTKYLKELARRTKNQKKWIQYREKIADVVLASPSDHQFLSRKDVVNITLLGNMLNETSLREVKSRFSNECSAKEQIKILHCPSNIVGKGSFVIEKIISELKDNHPEIELIFAHEKSNPEILQLITECDFVVDSVWNSSPAGAFPAEAGFLGKPVVIGSYFSKLKTKIYSGKNVIPPFIFVHPDELSHAIEKLVVDAEYRCNVGRKLKVYFHEISPPKIVASKYARILSSGPKRADFFDPKSFSYIHGYGISELQLRQNLSQYININGVNALCLEHNSELQKKIEQFVNGCPEF